MERSDFLQLLDKTFPNKCGIHNQWRGEHMWVDYFGSFAIVWNAKNMRYKHAQFGNEQTPINYDEAAEYITANHSTTLDVPEKYKVAAPASGKK